MLKQQDPLINHIQSLIQEARGAGVASPVHHAFSLVQGQLDDHFHRQHSGAPTLLSGPCPAVNSLFQRLDVLRALEEYDTGTRLTSRVHVPPTFTELRTVLNLAVVHAAAPPLQLLTLDADDTLYSDGGCLSFDAPCIPWLIRLLRLGVRVAVVTAASYPGAPERYENRLAGLLSAIAFAVEAGAPPGPLTENFFLMGGQCNYCLRLRCSAGPPVRVYLEEVPGAAWKRFRGVRWNVEEVKATLDVAEGALRATTAKLHLAAKVLLIRKERAVGVIAKDNATAPLSYEVLEELTLATQAALVEFASKVPTCAFNGGHDVFVDIGSKALGLAALQGLLGATPQTTIHVGDRFTSTGNDLRARDCASTLWTSSPANTLELLQRLVPLVAEARAAASPSPPPSPSLQAAAAAAAAAAEGSATSSAAPIPAAAAAAASDATLSASPTLGAHVIVQPPPLPSIRSSHHHLPSISSSNSLHSLLPPSPNPSGSHHQHGVGAEASFASEDGAAAERDMANHKSLWLAAGGEIVPTEEAAGFAPPRQ